MKTLAETILAKSPIKKLTHVRDLVYFDGPLLSVYTNAKNEPFLRYWCDCDEHQNRWMILRVSSEDIQKLTLRQLALDDVIPAAVKDDYVLFEDVGDEISSATVRLVLLDDIPDDYKPRERSFLEPGPAFALAQRNVQKQSESSAAAAETDFRAAGRWYAQYAFSHLTSHFMPIVAVDVLAHHFEAWIHASVAKHVLHPEGFNRIGLVSYVHTPRDLDPILEDIFPQSLAPYLRVKSLLSLSRPGTVMTRPFRFDQNRNQIVDSLQQLLASLNIQSRIDLQEVSSLIEIAYAAVAYYEALAYLTRLVSGTELHQSRYTTVWR